MRPWFRRYGPAGREAATRLVCLPHAGGAASLFRTWGGYLPPEVDLLATCYPGRQERIGEACRDRMDVLADEIADALLPLSDLPLALFGHSMGASVAHEVALRLNRAGAPPAALFVSARQPPHRLEARPEVDDGSIVDDVLRLDPDSAVALRDPHLRELVLPALRADYRLVAGYRPGPLPLLDVPVTAYFGSEDPDVSPAEMREWASVTTGEFRSRGFPGGHFYLTPHQAALVGDLAARLSAWSGQRRPGQVRPSRIRATEGR
ncbi:thioesterase [Amycolatopsis rhizosphaerae]|uniref:Thioesterase n=1 Tax=Amycolatopsis rhizosphaerae TaxID=2053003 RepID=A0A558DJJ2_9PSEU|nr:thioesterase [Amycolatopsis rhizosphaerae]